MALKIWNEDTADRLCKAFKVACDSGLLVGRGGLIEQLHYLGHYGEAYGGDKEFEMETTIYPDFAPLSFGFTIKMRKNEPGAQFQPFLNGGLIFSGPEQPLDGSFPALTVGIGAPVRGWSVHT